MIESVRGGPASEPVWSRARSARVRSSRASDPTIRYVVPDVSAGLLPVGIASILSIRLHAYSGTATSMRMNSRTISPTVRRNQLRRFFGRACGGRFAYRGSMGCG